MSASIAVSINWDGTTIVVSGYHDLESQGSPADSLTTVHDVIEMLRDCARRAEAAVAEGMKEVMD